MLISQCYLLKVLEELSWKFTVTGKVTIDLLQQNEALKCLLGHCDILHEVAHSNIFDVCHNVKQLNTKDDAKVC